MHAHRELAAAGAAGRSGCHVVDALKVAGRDDVAFWRRGRGYCDDLVETLAGVIAVATRPSPDQKAATAFAIVAAQNLHEAGKWAGVWWMVVPSIIGCDRFTASYNAAKVAHERGMLSDPIPVRVRRG